MYLICVDHKSSILKAVHAYLQMLHNFGVDTNVAV